MSLSDKLCFPTFSTLFLISFSVFSLISNLSSYFDSIVLILGRLLVLLIISWFSTKIIRQYLDKQLISSNKRAVLITGCDTGFGNAAALRLNEQGYTVYATVLNPDSIGAKQLINGSRFSSKTKVFKMDVRYDEEVNAVYGLIKKDLKLNGEELWAVVNNAGIGNCGPIDWGTMENCINMFDVNTFGTVRVTRAFLQLIRQSKGRVVNIASVAGRSAAPNMSIYSMTKSAVISFSDTLRRENKKWGIKVSSIEPMGHKTQMADIQSYYRIIDSYWEQTSDEVKEVYGQQFYESFRSKSILFKILKSAQNNKMDGVVDTIVEAIRKPEPQISYTVSYSRVEKLIFCLLQYLPDQMNDWFYQLFDSEVEDPAQLIRE